MRMLRKILRMEVYEFLHLCNNLKNSYGLYASKHMIVVEKEFLSLYWPKVYHIECFQYSGKIINRIFLEVLKSLCMLAKDLISLTD